MAKKKISLPEIELSVTQVPRPCSISLRLTKAERALLDAVAKKFKISISDLARSILVQSLEYMLHEKEKE